MFGGEGAEKRRRDEKGKPVKTSFSLRGNLNKNESRIKGILAVEKKVRERRDEM